MYFSNIVVLFAVTLSQYSCQEVEFGGKEVITLDLTNSRIAAESNRITFRFKTINSFGLILYSKGTQGDYISIELVQGSLRYQADLGSTSQTISKQQIIIGNDLSNNKWHSVDIIRIKNAVNITIDGGRDKSMALDAASFTRLDLDDKIFVGGVLFDTKLDTSLGLMSRNYIGCLQNLHFDNYHISNDVKYNGANYRSYGDIRYKCTEFVYSPVSFPNYTSIMEIPTYVQRSFSLKLRFRTYMRDSMLLSKISNDGKIFVEIRNGKLTLRVESKKITPIKLEVGNDLNNGYWHGIHCLVNAKNVSITLNKEKPLVYRHPSLKDITYDAPHVVLGGGADNILTGFTGCVYSITVDGTFIVPQFLESKRMKGALLNKCNVKNKCWPNPCKNGGFCQKSGNGFLCDCTRTLYTGQTCQEPIVQKTCQDYKSLGLREDSYCHIDPDGTGPLDSYEVLCNVTKQEKAITIIPLQNSMKRIKVSHGTPLRGTKYYQQMIYPFAMEKIYALIKASTDCKQFVRFECKNSPLLNSPRGPSYVSWVNRQGLLEDYWGGAPKDSNKCACGVKKTCSDATKYCNCDRGDNFWREDSGFLTDKEALPVTLIQFDARTAQSYFTVSNLECTTTVTPNTSTPSPTSRAKPRRIIPLRACRSVIKKPTTKAQPTTKVHIRLPQSEKIVSKKPFTIRNLIPTVGKRRDRTKSRPIIKPKVERPKGKKASGNYSLNAAKSEGKTHNGVTISMSILAVIVISASIVLVWAIIAVIVIVRRKRRYSREEQNQNHEDHEEGTEMCILFRQSKREAARPTIELRRDSYDSYDSVPTPALEYTAQTGFRQPITTHITLDYARAKKKKNSSAYFCS